MQGVVVCQDVRRESGAVAGVGAEDDGVQRCEDWRGGGEEERGEGARGRGADDVEREGALRAWGGGGVVGWWELTR